MAGPRRDNAPNSAFYNRVPNPSPSTSGNMTPSNSSSYLLQNTGTGRQDAMTQGVMTGSVGSTYGPYSYNPTLRDSAAHSQQPSRFSAAHSVESAITSSHSVTEKSALPSSSATIPLFAWDQNDPELDDFMHNPDPKGDKAPFTLFSGRGWANVGFLVVLLVGIIMLFAGYPIIAATTGSSSGNLGASNIGGTNSTGQVASFTGMPSLIDADTDASVYTRTGSDGKEYNLVFSDEFNSDGRTFWPGDDPYWEAVNLNYWATGDLEWYDPAAITTKDGNLVITMTQKWNHNLNFMSGMLQSWNKLCFTTGYLEVNVSLPGAHNTPGFWPGIWTMGNLGRAGYGATTDGMWPYSYDTCDLGTFPNQTNTDGTTPAAALTGSSSGGELSYLPGQRASACTCSGEDHPGPDVSVGRAAPEIDILEAQIDVDVEGMRGQVSQSLQVAPFNYQYQFDNASDVTTVTDDTLTSFNTYKGGLYQQAVSALTYIDDDVYGGENFATYAIEVWSNKDARDEGYIQWYSQGKESWKVTAGSVGADSTTEISERLIPEEPMYIIFNFGLSPNFQAPDYKHLTFPNEMHIDYVRLYQRSDVSDGLTCDPPNYPTSDYINNHANAYNNPNLTVWTDAGYSRPKNSKYDGC